MTIIFRICFWVAWAETWIIHVQATCKHNETSDQFLIVTKTCSNSRKSAKLTKHMHIVFHSTLAGISHLTIIAPNNKKQYTLDCYIFKMSSHTPYCSKEIKCQEKTENTKPKTKIQTIFSMALAATRVTFVFFPDAGAFTIADRAMSTGWECFKSLM